MDSQDRYRECDLESVQQTAAARHENLEASVTKRYEDNAGTGASFDLHSSWSY